MKESGVGQGVSVNGLLSGGITGTINFTAYISPYLVLNNGGYYTKHIYMGSQRIVSKLGSSDIFTIRNPLTDTTANNQNFVPKLTDLTGKIKVRFDSLGVVYKGTSQGNVGMITSTAGRIPTPLKYYFHSDHLGSSSLITDATGGIVQHLEYIPFGEVFIDERAATSTWSTPYKFNAKELDEETGLYYYGARYYDPRSSVWISKDPLAEKYPNVGSYVYCVNNPVKFIDPDGNQYILHSQARIIAQNGTIMLKIENLNAPTWNRFMDMNNDTRFWKSGEIGVNITIGNVEFISPSITKAESANLDNTYGATDPTYNPTITKTERGTKSNGTSDLRQNERGIYGVTARTRGAAGFMLILNAVNFGLETASGLLINDDLNKIKSNIKLLQSAIKDVNKAAQNGRIPPKYQNKKDMIDILNVVFQGENTTKNKDILNIGIEILKKNGNYDSTKFNKK